LEACIVLPIFIMLMMFVYGFFILFAGQNVISHALIQSAQSLSLDSYSFEKLKSEGEGIQMTDIMNELVDELVISSDYFSTSEKWYSDDIASMNEVVKNRFIGYLVGADPTSTKANELLDYFGVDNGLSGFDFSASKVENGYLTLTVRYKQKFLFDFDDNVMMDLEQSVKVKMWGI